MPRYDYARRIEPAVKHAHHMHGGLSLKGIARFAGNALQNQDVQNVAAKGLGALGSFLASKGAGIRLAGAGRRRRHRRHAPKKVHLML